MTVLISSNNYLIYDKLLLKSLQEYATILVPHISDVMRKKKSDTRRDVMTMTKLDSEEDLKCTKTQNNVCG